MPTCSNWWCRYNRSNNNVEITSYILSAVLQDDQSSDAVNDMKMMKYLQTKRNSYGGWSNTQNTMAAISALSQYALKYTVNTETADSENNPLSIHINTMSGTQDEQPRVETGDGIVIQ